MKKTLLTCGLMMTGIAMFAQSHHSSKSMTTKYQQLVQSLINKQTHAEGTAQKPTGMLQRVIAQASIDGSSGMEDSARYKYSGTRTSRYNHNTIFEEPSYNWEFTSDVFTGPILNLIPSSADLQADSILSYDDQSMLYGFSKAFYRSDNKIDSFFNYTDEGMSQIDIAATKHIFNSNGFITQITDLNNFINPPAIDTNGYRKLSYNTAGTQLLKDTMYNYNGSNIVPSYVTLYFYDVQNRLDSVVELEENSGAYQLSNVTKIQYDASNRLLELVGNYYNGGVVEGGSIFSFNYTGTSTLYTLLEQSDIYNNDTATSVVMKTLGANNLPDTMKKGSYENGIFELDLAFKYFYNTYNNPDSLIAYDIDGEFVGRYNFYYETYDDGNNVGIKETKANKNFNIYPNPFDNKINIEWKSTATNAKISLVNMVGQTIYTVNKSLSTGNNAIDIPATTSGNYILMIQDEKGNTYNQKLSRR